MWVNLAITHNKTGDESAFALQEGDDVVKQPDGSYNVRFAPRTTHQEVFVQTMDGTAESRTMGLKIVPTMIEDNVHVVPNSGGKRPHQYYVGVPVPRVLVCNDAPRLDEEFDVYPVPSTNAIPVSIGAADEAIRWTFDDVALDFARGITVEFRGGGGWGPKTYTNRTEALADGAVGFVPTFGFTGLQSVRLMVKDKDGGTATVIWEYIVAYPTEEVDGVTWDYAVNNGEATVFGVTSAKDAISMPSVLGGCPVTRIGFRAFSECGGLTSVTIPTNVTNIGDYAFKGCGELISINFLGNAPDLGEGVFEGVNPGCTAYVRPDSTGWGVDIPGTWNGLAIRYAEPDDPDTCMVVFNANGGVGHMDVQTIAVGKVAKLTLCAFDAPAGKRFAGWRRKDNGRRYDDGMLVFNLAGEDGVVVLEAVWEDLPR